MTQTAAILSKVGALRLELPSAGINVMPGVQWGCIAAFPTPAYWVYQVVSKRIQGGPPEYRLGRTLAEEVGACLLGGHGIPATVGLAAFEHLRSAGAFRDTPPGEDRLLAWLQQPLSVHGRQIRYRFAAQKARYLSAALRLVQDAPLTNSGRVLRDWLLDIPGIGYKTASWVARNWLCADDVAILDIHILRFGQAIRLFPENLTVERHYLELEKLFLEFSTRVDVRASELDAVIWHEMATSPLSVRQLVDGKLDLDNERLSRTKKRKSDSAQLPLLA
jgi:N-glycosylase/DNA lyase